LWLCSSPGLLALRSRPLCLPSLSRMLALYRLLRLLLALAHELLLMLDGFSALLSIALGRRPWQARGRRPWQARCVHRS